MLRRSRPLPVDPPRSHLLTSADSNKSARSGAAPTTLNSLTERAGGRNPGRARPYQTPTASARPSVGIRDRRAGGPASFFRSLLLCCSTPSVPPGVSSRPAGDVVVAAEAVLAAPEAVLAQLVVEGRPV